MTTYRAPLRDMQFALGEIAGLGGVAALPGYEDATGELADAILEAAAKRASDVLSPLNKSGDQQGASLSAQGAVAASGFASAYRSFVAGGWNGLGGDPAFDGQGLSALVTAAAVEMWNSANMSFALRPLLTAGAIEAIKAHASEELKQKCRKKLVTGEWTGTMNLTEPQAGSDLAAVRSKAVPEDDHYRISGQKIFITWGDHGMAENIVHLVLARLPDAPEGTRGISLFLAPKIPCERRRIARRTERRALQFYRSQIGHARESHVCDEFWSKSRSHRLSSWREKSGSGAYVYDDE